MFVSLTKIRECGRWTFNSNPRTISLLLYTSVALPRPVCASVIQPTSIPGSLPTLSLIIPNVVECGMKLVLSPRLMRWNAVSAL